MLEGITLQGICNAIVLIGAVIVAVKSIYNFFKKPVDDIQTKNNQREEKHIEEVLEKKLPSILNKNQEEIVLSLSELKSLALDSKSRLDKVQTSMQLMNDSQMDLMRYNMNRIYYKYRPYKKILDCDKKGFIKFYQDYHSMGGNTWIDAIYPEVMSWEIVEDEKELKN